MDWGSVPPLLSVVVVAVAALAGAMWAVVRVIRSEVTERIEYRFDATDAKFESRLDAMADRIEVMDAKFGTRFDAVTDRFDGVDKRIDGVDRRIDELRADFRSLADRVDRLIEGLPALQVT